MPRTCGKGDNSAMEQMVLVPGGEFLQGSPPWLVDWMLASDQPLPRDWFGDETPQIRRTVEPFWMARHPVTVAEFATFVRQTGYVTDAERRGFGMIYDDFGWTEHDGVWWREPGGPGVVPDDYDDHPVVNVSWDDANAYTDWAGLRLPTEAEWEFAARGVEVRIWPWGDDWQGDNANTAEYHAGTLTTLDSWREWWLTLYAKRGPVPLSTPVGAFSGRGDSVHGCADMAGNVYEWTSTVSHLYDESTRCDPTMHATVGRYRVIRGGSWMNFRYQVRCTERMHGDPLGWSSFAHGFRCAKDA